MPIILKMKPQFCEDIYYILYIVQRCSNICNFIVQQIVQIVVIFITNITFEEYDLNIAISAIHTSRAIGPSSRDETSGLITVVNKHTRLPILSNHKI